MNISLNLNVYIFPQKSQKKYTGMPVESYLYVDSGRTYYIHNRVLDVHRKVFTKVSTD
jgi:hypothetical protein